jgi:hypothetical protein
MFAGQEGGAPGVDEAGERLHQDGPTEVGQVTGQLVEVIWIQHRRQHYAPE